MTFGSTYNAPTFLSKAFQSLNGLLYIDPEDIDMEVLEQTFKEALAAHDYFYDYSDDGEVYRRGRLEATIIYETVTRHPELNDIYQAYIKEKEGK